MIARKPLSVSLTAEARSLICRCENRRVRDGVLKDFDENMPMHEDKRQQEQAQVRYCKKVIEFYRQAASA